MKRGRHTCEWCEEMATNRISRKHSDYERFACDDRAHQNKAEMLVEMDSAPIGDYLVKREYEAKGFLVAV